MTLHVKDPLWGLHFLVAAEFVLCVCSCLCTVCFHLVSPWSLWVIPPVPQDGCFCLFLMCILTVCLCMLCLVCSVIPLVFLQVLEPFCPLSEQESLEPEDLGVSLRTCSTTVLITSESELNPSDSSSSAHKDLPCTDSLTDTEAVPVSLTAIASPSFPDADSVLPPPPLSDCTSTPLPCLESVPPLSNCLSSPLSEALPAEDDSGVPPQTQSEPIISHPCEDVIATSISEILSDESNSSQIENPLVKIVASRSSLQNNEDSSLQEPDSLPESVV